VTEPGVGYRWVGETSGGDVEGTGSTPDRAG